MVRDPEASMDRVQVISMAQEVTMEIIPVISTDKILVSTDNLHSMDLRVIMDRDNLDKVQCMVKDSMDRKVRVSMVARDKAINMVHSMVRVRSMDRVLSNTDSMEVSMDKDKTPDNTEEVRAGDLRICKSMDNAVTIRETMEANSAKVNMARDNRADMVRDIIRVTTTRVLADKIIIAQETADQDSNMDPATEIVVQEAVVPAVAMEAEAVETAAMKTAAAIHMVSVVLADIVEKAEWVTAE
jgi:hypothetical protein